MKSLHVPVMVRESLDSLDIKPNGVYVDCTFGCGGHTREILKALGKTGKLIAFDVDSIAGEEASQLKEQNFFFVRENFSNLAISLEKIGVNFVNGFLFDLGLSSAQLASQRGFSYRSSSPLDMRMNENSSLTAIDLLRDYSVRELADIFFNFGEERRAFKIANAIGRYRENNQLTNSSELVRIVTAVLGKNKNGAHPAKKVFQALRIKVNNELEVLENALRDAWKNLALNGRIVVISYHSLEDRIVKKFFKSKASEGISLYKKPLTSSCEEITSNNRSRSAKLRVLCKVSFESFSFK